MIELDDDLATIKDEQTRKEIKAFYMSQVGNRKNCPHTWFQKIEEGYSRCIGCCVVFQDDEPSEEKEQE